MNNHKRTLRVGTRGSALALKQAERVLAGLDGPSEMVIVSTSGDRFENEPLGEKNPVGFFTKEIEDCLLSGKIDLAVHSLKDLPVVLAPGLEFGALLARDDPEDVLLARPEAVNSSRVFPLKDGSRVGASSRRRQALLKFYRPDAEALPIRGNVPTRVEKARRGDYDAILLSRAGLQRLKLDVSPLVAFDLNPARWPVAPGQSVIAVEARSGDEEAMARAAPLNDAATCERVNVERRLLRAFGGGCHAPFGAFAKKGEGAATVMVGAPGGDGNSFVITGFRDETLEKASSAAEEWIRSGCMPRKDAAQEGEWLARAARPWC